jgi:hypothetical protein
MVHILRIVLALLFMLGTLNLAAAQEPPKQEPAKQEQPKPEQPKPEPPKLGFKYGGVFNTWGLWQRDFRLGAIDYRDQYLVQMFRLNFTFGYGDNIKAITRFDLAQGWYSIRSAIESVPRA